MSSASRAMNRLRKQYRSVLDHMREKNAPQANSAGLAPLGHWPCHLEPLEPRLLLDATGPQIVAHWPDGIVGASVDHLEVTFNEAIDPATFTPEDVSVLLTTPALVGNYDTDGYAFDVEVVGTLAYVADCFSLRIIDVSSPAAPVEVGYYETPGYVQSVHVVGSLAYLAEEDSGLQIIDVSDPAAPTEVGYHDTPGYARGVQVVGSLAYVADGEYGLRIIDVSDPAAPAEVGYYDTPGDAMDIHVVGSLAYVADGYGALRIIDVSDPAAPAEVGYYDTPGFAHDVQVVGTLAYVADYFSGLRILDVSDPAAPTEVGYWDTPDRARDVQVIGTLAYVAGDYSGLRVIDVSDPAAPAEVGYYPDGRAYGVQVVGSLAYLAGYDSGLQILEVLKEASGVTAVNATTFRIDLPGTLADGGYQVFIAPDVADLAGNLMDQNGDGVGGQTPADRYAFSFITDATVPLMPTDLAFASDTGPADGITTDTGLVFTWSAPPDCAGIASYEYRWDGGGWTSTTGTSSPVLPAAEGEHTFEVRAVDVLGRPGAATSMTVTVDLTAPAVPTGLRLDGAVLHWDAATDANGIWQYLVGIDWVNWSNTTSLLFDTGLAEGASAIFAVRAMDRAGNVGPFATATLTADYGPRVTGYTPVDLVDDPGAMAVTVTFNEAIDPLTLTAEDVQVALSSPTLLGAYNEDCYAAEVVVSGSLAYVAAGGGGLRIFDVSDPAAPAEVGSYETPGYARGVQVVGTLAYLADGEGGLRILDVSDPAAPMQVGHLDTPGDAFTVQVVGTLAYLADWGSALRIIDVSTPAAPVQIGSYPVQWTRSIQVVGELAYVADFGQGLVILDVSNPAAPRWIANHHTPNCAFGVNVAGTLAYVVEGDGGLQIFDVSNPAAPAELGHYDTPGNAWGVQVVGTLAYVADDNWGVQILDVSNPAAPTAVGYYDTPGHANTVQVVGTRAYVADADDGLAILEVFKEVSGVTAVDAVTYRIDLPGALPDNRYHVVVGPDVTDQAGNTMDQNSNGVGGMAPYDVYSFDVVIDATPPAAPEDIGYADDTGSMDNVTADELLTFSWSGPWDLAGIASYEYRWDGGDWTATTDTASPELPGAEGWHTFEVRAIDTLGRTGQIASRTVVVDTTAPGAPTGLRLVDGAVLQWNPATDANGVWKYQVRVDGGAWSEAFFPQAGVSLGDGVGGLCEVRAVDKAGNVGQTAAATLTPDYGPQVVSHDVDVTEGGACSFTITFDEPIDASTFTAEDVQMLRPAPQIVTTGYVPGGYVEEILASGTRAYVILDEEGVIQILDVSDPYSPVYLGDFGLFPGIEGGDIVGTMAYLTLGDGGLVIVDLSDPASPQTFSAFALGGWAYDIRVSGTRAYVMVRDVGLQILDVSDPSAPVLLGGGEFFGKADIMTVTDTLVCLIGQDDGIYTIDASNPASPTLLNYYAIDTDPGTVAGTMVYMADEFLRIFDFSNPIAPVLLGSYDAGGWIEGIVVSGTLAFVEIEDQGLQIVDVSDPASPELLVTYDVSEARSVSLFGAVAYLSAGSNGLLALEVMQKVESVTAVDATTYRIDLADAIGEGEYRVFVGPGVADLAGNTMDQNGDGVGGQPSDTYAFTFGGPASVEGRHVFYNNSAWDGNNADANQADDSAIATDKQALLPGGTVGTANSTSYSRGINGIMIDIAGLAGAPDSGDFLCRVGNTDDPSTWIQAAAPLGITVRPGEGVNGSDRVTVIWADNAIRNQWLEVTVLSDDHGGGLGLAEDDVFCFGNVVGDADGDGTVDAADYIAVKRAFGSSNASPGGAGDFDCSGTVDYGDLMTLQGNFGQSINMDLSSPGQATPAASGMSTTTGAVQNVVAETAGAVVEPEPLAPLAAEAAAAATTAGLPAGLRVASSTIQAAAGILDDLANSRPPLLLATPSHAQPSYAERSTRLAGVGPLSIPASCPSPLRNPGRSGQEVADILALAGPWGSGDSARRESPDEPWMTRLTVDIAGKLRKKGLGPVVLDVLAASR